VANIKSQIKRNKQNLRRHERNKAVRSELKTRTKNAVAAAETGADDLDAKAALAQKRLGKAAAKGVIHKNAAARRQSRLARRLNALRAGSLAE
jgi:small subunit ribosomal protein S20